MKVQILVSVAALLAFVWGYRGDAIRARFNEGPRGVERGSDEKVVPQLVPAPPSAPSPASVSPPAPAVQANPVAIPRPVPPPGNSLTNALHAATPEQSGEDIERRRSEYQQLQAERPPLPQQPPMGAIPNPILPPAVTNAIPPVDESAGEEDEGGEEEEEEVFEGDDAEEDEEDLSEDDEEDLEDEADLGDEEDPADEEDA